jgi:putative endonuclease
MLAAVVPCEAESWKERLKAMGLSRVRRRSPVEPSGPPRVATTFRGREGEEAAAAFLQGQGVHILERNVRERGSEIDIIGMVGPIVVFFEVKRRRNSDFGSAAEAVTVSKRRRIVGGARRWLSAHRSTSGHEVRFDVVTVEDEAATIQWIQGAFDATFP